MRAVLDHPEWSGISLWLFCNANTYTRTTHKTGRPRGYNNKGLLDEYRRPKMAWNTLKKLIRQEKQPDERNL